MNTTREYTYFDVLAAREIGADAINEVSLSRAWRNIQQAGEKSFGVLTAFRGVLPKRENFARNDKLKQDIRSMGLGFDQMDGHWQECREKDTPWQDCPKDLLMDVTEESLFVVGISLDDLNRLGNKYEQQAWIYAGPETSGNVELWSSDGKIMDLGKFHPNRIAQAYSQLKGSRTFTFEARANGFFEGLLESALRKSPDVLRVRVDVLRTQLAPR
jgi:hypothetical protein